MESIEEMLGLAQEQAKVVASELGRFKHARAQVTKNPKSVAAKTWDRRRRHAFLEANRALTDTLANLAVALKADDERRVAEAVS